MRCSRPLPISLPEPCIGTMVDLPPSVTLMWLPLAGRNVHPRFSSYRFISALVTIYDVTDMLLVNRTVAGSVYAGSGPFRVVQGDLAVVFLCIVHSSAFLLP
jgi:hypothetical protein